ncbi:MAG: DUF4126 domain-containing protein [Saprospiraceae bacterium]|nr:DUF4126 domain-containing protein [Saprospiraceae bacterium]
MSEWILPVLLGIGLSAATGLRIFVPFFIISVIQYFDILPIGETFHWLDNPYVMIALGIAVVIEILGYYIPIIDHTLDIIGAPLAFCAGVISMAAVMPEMPVYFDKILSLIVGGGTAVSINGLSGMMRLKTTATFFGMANSTYSTIENLMSFLFTVLAFLIPVLFGVGIILVVLLSYRIIRKQVYRIYGKLTEKSS